jgi:HD superfamily phosphodiesterase
MNDLELRLKELDPGLFAKFEETKTEVNLLQGKYSENFSTYTDHSLAHTYEVFTIASDLLTKQEIDNLNVDEIYILSMACILHDIGMCIPPEKIDEVSGNKEFSEFIKVNPELSIQVYIRDIK